MKDFIVDFGVEFSFDIEDVSSHEENEGKTHSKEDHDRREIPIGLIREEGRLSSPACNENQLTRKQQFPTLELDFPPNGLLSLHFPRQFVEIHWNQIDLREERKQYVIPFQIQPRQHILIFVLKLKYF